MRRSRSSSTSARSRSRRLQKAGATGGEATGGIGGAGQDSWPSKSPQKEKVEEIDTKITEERINASTTDPRARTPSKPRSRNESQQQTLAFETELAELQGKKQRHGARGDRGGSAEANAADRAVQRVRGGEGVADGGAGSVEER